VIERAWPGFAAQKNFAIEQCSGEWVLSLDADEELTPELQQEIQKLLGSNPQLDAFYLKRRNYFLGKWIRHGGFYPDAKLRLFRRGAAKFAERAVHETIAFDGKTETLKFDLIHHAYTTLASYIEHMNRYSSLGAEVLIAQQRTSHSWIAFVVNVMYVPQLMLQRNYVFRLGFLDGREGLLLHMYHAVYTSWKYAKAWELTRRQH
jgi:glycosyltransferase involved in cell wall biosynthesis